MNGSQDVCSFSHDREREIRGGWVGRERKRVGKKEREIEIERIIIEHPTDCGC